MYQPLGPNELQFGRDIIETSATITNQWVLPGVNLVNPEMSVEFVDSQSHEYHNSQLKSQEFFGSGSVDASESIFLESIIELEEKALKFKGKENVNPSITLSAEKLKIIEANKQKALEIKKKKADEY